MNKPLLSVIVPVYNSEQYLPECIDSILKQTYQNLEIILVDDGSTDSSGVICDTYAQKEGRVKVFHQENGGLSSARNSGLSIITGDYFTFVDSDDVLSLEMFSKMLYAADCFHAPMVICGCAYYSEGNLSAIPCPRSYDGIELTSSHQLIEQLYTSEYDNNLFTAPWGKIYSSKKFSTLVHYKEGIIFEDDDLANRLFLEKFPIAVVHEPLYLWRMTPNSITHQPFKRDKCIMLSILLERVQNFSVAGFTDSAARVAKVFFELYIEYYYKSVDLGHPEWVLEYRNAWQYMKSYLRWRGMEKARIRYLIFELSPILYRKIVLRLHRGKF